MGDNPTLYGPDGEIVRNNNDKSPGPPTQAEQYKMLREEIVQHMVEIYRTQVWGAVAVGSIYTWLLANRDKIPSRAIWFIGPIVILGCMIRCWDLVRRMAGISPYLCRLERIAFSDPYAPGWERYKIENPKMDRDTNARAAVVWTAFFLCSVMASVWFSRSPQLAGASNAPSTWTRDRVGEAADLESRADVVLTVQGAVRVHGVRLLRPVPLKSTELVERADFEDALRSIQSRRLAILETYAYGFDTNRLTNAATQLRRCGFQNLRVITVSSSGISPGPEL